MRLIDADELEKRRIDYIVNGYADSVSDMAEWGMALKEAPTVDAVSRAEAIDVVCDKCPISFKEKCEWRDNGHCSMKVALEALPTVDAIEVVRCKDCKYSIDRYNDGDCYCRHPKYNGEALLYIQEGWTHYCSYAERKDKRD